MIPFRSISKFFLYPRNCDITYLVIKFVDLKALVFGFKSVFFYYNITILKSQHAQTNSMYFLPKKTSVLNVNIFQFLEFK